MTRLTNTTLGRFVKQIEAKPDPATIDLGFMLLTLSEDTVVEISKGIDKISAQASQDHRRHDFTVSIGAGRTGLTIHCNDEPISIAGPRLQAHCAGRKYTQQANTWFGVCVHSEDASLRFGVNLNYKWEQSAEMDTVAKYFTDPIKRSDRRSATVQKPKIGRNEPCPCGSGKKRKKCCLS